MAAGLGDAVDVELLAQHVVEAVTAVTDFAVATLTLREGDTCRRVAAAGTSHPRLGLRTSYARWSQLLQEQYRYRSACFLIPPGASNTEWSQTVPVTTPARPVGDRVCWTSEHGLVVELVEAGERIGFLSVDAPRSGLLPEDTDLAPLELFARQVQTALHNARLHAEVVRQRDTAEALRAVVTAVSGTLDLREVLRCCSDAVVAHSIGDRASVFLHDPDAGHFRTVMTRGGPRDTRLWDAFRDLPPITLDDAPLFAEAFDTGRPVLVERVTDEHVGAVMRQLFSLKSVAVYPIWSADEVVGMLAVDTFREHVTFPATEVALVTQIAAQAGVALHQAQLHQAVRAHAARADELYELTKQMTRTFDFDRVFARIVDAVTTRTDAYAVGLMEVVDDRLVLLRTNLDVAEPSGLPYQEVPTRDLASLWDRLRDHGMLRIDRVSTSALAAFARPRARSVLVAGHRDGGHVSLVLHLSSDRVAAFSADDAEFAEGLVEVAALALRNARLYEDVRRLAEVDSLTGLKNRRTYTTDLAELLASATLAEPLALILVDVDDFKAVNDRHGHDVGDRALIHVADRIRRAVREVDRVYRLGGEEFAVLVPATTATDARRVGDRIREGVTVTRSALPRVTVSVGVAVAPVQATAADELFRAADAALYAAKDAGKDTVRLARSQSCRMPLPGPHGHAGLVNPG